MSIAVLDAKRDYGDGPAVYGNVWHRAMEDVNEDGVLDGTNNVWLGTATSFETAQYDDPDAAADAADDAISFGTGTGDFPMAPAPSTVYTVDVTVNSSAADVVYYGMWIDWDEDGVYEDFYSGSQVTASPAIASIDITTPSIISALVNIRLRADDKPLAPLDYMGGKNNGEVEDYQPSRLLPVTLVNFTAVAKGCDVNLQWATESQENFSHFEIQRSKNASEFRTIHQVNSPAFSDALRYYQYTDETAASGYMYRLKMVNLDGTFEYSTLRAVKTECAARNIYLFPNPIGINGDNLQVKFYTEEENIQYQISDMMGRVVQVKNIDTEIETMNTLRIDVSEFPVGVYVLKFEGNSSGNRFVVQE